MAARIAETMRDAPTTRRSSWRRRGAFPLFNADLYLSGGSFASRLPQAPEGPIRAHGIRNSHLLSIAPTGTISWPLPTTRATASSRRSAGPTSARSAGRRHAEGVRGRGPRLAPVPPPEGRGRAAHAGLRHRPSAMSAQAHAEMVAAVAPLIDTAISKTVNVPADYPFADFEHLYRPGLGIGPQGLATYRPNAVLGSVLSTTESKPAPLTAQGANRASPSTGVCRPRCSRRCAGRAARCCRRQRGLDLHDRASVRRFRALRRRVAGGGDGAPARVQPSRSGSTARSSRAAWARWPRRCRWTCAPTIRPGSRSSSTRWRRWPKSARSRCASAARRAPAVPSRRRRDGGGDPLALRAARRADAQLGAGATPVLDAMFSRDEPRTGTSGTLAWSVTSTTQRRGELMTLTVKEITLPGRRRRRHYATVRGLRATTRARSTAWRACCRWTCASSTRHGSA